MNCTEKTNNFHQFTKGTTSSPVSFVPDSTLRTRTAVKRSIGEFEDEFSETDSSASSSARETPSPLKKLKERQITIKWLDHEDRTRNTPISNAIASTYRITDKAEDSDDDEAGTTSGCTSVSASDLWQPPSLYEFNEEQSLDEDSKSEEPKVGSFKRSAKSGLFADVTDEDLSDLFKGLDVNDLEEGLFF